MQAWRGRFVAIAWAGEGEKTMEKSIFGYVWRYSKPQQIIIILLTLASMPFLYILLDLPKYIVNDAIDGKNFPRQVFGFEFGQVEYLLLLCAGLLALLIINAVFSMVINTYKGVTAERLIRRLRYQLFESILRFPTKHFQKVTPPALSSMITAEVEPMADFISDSFAMPMVQGGTMVTILFFMMVEDPILGLVAIAMVPVQAYLIPKLQRKVNLLGRERVTKARELAGWVGEAVLGINDIHANDTSNYMQANVSRQLGRIFNIRYELYQKKFFMKSLNVFLSQLTPLFFYSAGGYLIIQGELSLGTLVAVLAAYSRFEAPWKELLKYYQRYNDIKIKYEQLVEQFTPGMMIPEQRMNERPEQIPRLRNAIDLQNVQLVDDGAKLLEDVSLSISPGDKLAIICEPATQDKFARLLARTIDPSGGKIVVGEMSLGNLPESVTGAAIGYAGPESYIFSGTIADNILYSVKRKPAVNGAAQDKDGLGYKETLASGNSVHELVEDWIDYEFLELETKDDLQDWMLRVIDCVELDNLLASRSLSMGLDPEAHPELASGMVSARKYVANRLAASEEIADLVRPFKFNAYNKNASVAANLIFGEPVGDEFIFSKLGANPLVRRVLDDCSLTEPFLKIGHKLAETLIELIGDDMPDEQLFQSFSFLDEESLTRLKAVTTQLQRSGSSAIDEASKALLISLMLQINVDRHRFGFITEDIQKKVVAARKVFRENLPAEKKQFIASFDADGFNPQLSNQCNLLMGRLNPTVSGAEQKTNEIIFEALAEQKIMDEMLLLATQYDVGVGGSRLSLADRQKIALARSVVKRPDILICNDAISSLDRSAQARMRQNIYKLLPDTTMVIFFSESPNEEEFDQVITLQDGRIASGLEPTRPATGDAVSDASHDVEQGPAPVILDSEAAALARIPLFSKIDPKYLKLLILNSRRLDFAPGSDLIKQGVTGQYAYVILEGEVNIVIGSEPNEKVIDTHGKNLLVGELSLLSDTLTTATVRASKKTSALRIEKQVFLQLMERDSLVASQVASWVSDRLVSSMKLLNEGR